LTEDFLPYAKAFVHAGGKHIYIATDSTKVLDEINGTWPEDVASRIRTIGNEVIRSTDDKAVFHIGMHHRTNVEALIEIAALARCHFMVHGLSAMSESAIWLNIGLHNRSVDLEDPDHVTAGSFGTLVQMALRGEAEERWPRPIPTDDWWTSEPVAAAASTTTACEDHTEILRIGYVRSDSSASAAFFIDVLNQLIYAEQFGMMPWVHLRNESTLVYDENIHARATNSSKKQSLDALDGYVVPSLSDPDNKETIILGKPTKRAADVSRKAYILQGNGIWDSYFEPVSRFSPDDESCVGKPVIEMDKDLVSFGLISHSRNSVRAWRYDDVPAHLWKPNNVPNNEWFEPMRRKANEIIKKYFRFRPHIVHRALKANPVSSDRPCLGIHFRAGFKPGKYRAKVTADPYLPYMEAFAQAGGHSIYIASDSHKPIQFIEKNFPEHLRKMIRTQGRFVVRTTKDWPTHFIENHHRVNSETLVDILALSKCSFLLHTHSTLSEAAIYLNLGLHNRSINMEDPDRMSPKQFEISASASLARLNPQSKTTSDVPARPSEILEVSPSRTSKVINFRLDNATILRHQTSRSCRENAVVYLAQKQHSTYGRDSYNIFKRSLEMLYKNYLSNQSHMNNTDVLIFYTGDFNRTDLGVIESRLGLESHGAVYLVDLSNSPYWSRPKSNEIDDPNSWYAYPLFSEGYRRMMHWYAIDIWDFFMRWNIESGCRYRYIMRLDEDSYIHSPIEYDVFDFFKQHKYVYGYRMCAYEMKVSQRMWTLYKKRNPAFIPKRELDLDMCGFYNNFFVADLNFFQSSSIQKFLGFIDKQGHIYRRRLGDLMIHTMSVIGFAPAERIHRFLDFTYEHATLNRSNGCLLWGGIQAGYNDPNASETVNEFFQSALLDRDCPGNATFLTEPDLSPTYSHIPSEWKGKVALQTVIAGNVELPAGKGILSG